MESQKPDKSRLRDSENLLLYLGLWILAVLYLIGLSYNPFICFKL